EQQPGYPRLVAWCIWIIADEREALRIAGCTAPAQRGRNVFAISRVYLGDCGAFQKGSTRQVHTGPSLNVLAAFAAWQKQQKAKPKPETSTHVLISIHSRCSAKRKHGNLFRLAFAVPAGRVSPVPH